MEYKINQFNFCDIKIADLHSLITYFELSIPRQKISTIFLGPNFLHLSLSKQKLKKSKEDRKLISTLCHLMIPNFSSKSEQTNFIFTTSNDQTKIFIKRFFKELNNTLQSKLPKMMQSSFNSIPSNELAQIYSFFDFFSFFTCLKEEKDEEISLCDYLLSITTDQGIRYHELSPFQFNYEIILNKLHPKSQMINVNNIHFFYMLLYNLSIEEIAQCLYCTQTSHYFNIFTNESQSDKIEDYAKRYVLINQFKLIKNDFQYNMFSKMQQNAKVIKEEYLYYKSLYEKYKEIKNILMINKTVDKMLNGIFLGMILLSEFNFYDDELYREILTQSKQNYSSSSIDLFNFIRTVVINDERFFYIQTKEQNTQRVKSNSILSKIALCLNISEEKIIFILITNFNQSGRGKIATTKDEINKNIEEFVYVLYQMAIDKIRAIFDSYNKQKKLVQTTTNNKINLIISRSNLVYESTYNTLSLTDNPYFTISNNIIDSNSYIITYNVKEKIIANYIQEMKNYLYLLNAVTITKNPKSPKMNYNDNFISKLFKEKFHFSTLLNLYDNSNYGLLKFLNESNSATNSDIKTQTSNFKQIFEQNLSQRGLIELVEVFNSELQIYQTYIKVKHTFGTFLYELNSILKKKEQSLILKEKTILKFLEYKPMFYNDDYFKYNEDFSKKILKKLSSQGNFVTLLIQLNKYNILTLIDDLKINHIYYYYSNFFNFVVNIKDLKESILNTKEVQFNQNLLKDEQALFKHLSKRIRISVMDYYYDNGFIFAKNRLSNAFEDNRNIANVIFKYNNELFTFLLTEYLIKSKFNYFSFAIKGIRAFVKLTKIYNEKKVLSNVRNLLTDVIVDNYDIIRKPLNKTNIEQNSITNQEIMFNNEMLSKLDELKELILDFEKEALSKILPKLRSNLAQLKRVWKNYVSDINYLENNIKMFSNQETTQLVIEQRLINFQILLFLFSKHYKFINSDSIKKYGVLVTEFTKTVSKEVLKMLNELYSEFQGFLTENNLNFTHFDNMNFEKLILKRIEVQHMSRKNSLKEIDDSETGRIKDFNIPTKELNEGRNINHMRSFRSKEDASRNNKTKGNKINTNIERDKDKDKDNDKDLKKELSFKNLNDNNEVNNMLKYNSPIIEIKERRDPNKEINNNNSKGIIDKEDNINLPEENESYHIKEIEKKNIEENKENIEYKDNEDNEDYKEIERNQSKNIENFQNNESERNLSKDIEYENKEIEPNESKSNINNNNIILEDLKPSKFNSLEKRNSKQKYTGSFRNFDQFLNSGSKDEPPQNKKQTLKKGNDNNDHNKNKIPNSHTHFKKDEFIDPNINKVPKEKVDNKMIEKSEAKRGKNSEIKNVKPEVIMEGTLKKKDEPKKNIYNNFGKRNLKQAERNKKEDLDRNNNIYKKKNLKKKDDDSLEHSNIKRNQPPIGVYKAKHNPESENRFKETRKTSKLNPEKNLIVIKPNNSERNLMENKPIYSEEDKTDNKYNHSDENKPFGSEKNIIEKLPTNLEKNIMDNQSNNKENIIDNKSNNFKENKPFNSEKYLIENKSNDSKENIIENKLNDSEENYTDNKSNHSEENIITNKYYNIHQLNSKDNQLSDDKNEEELVKEINPEQRHLFNKLEYNISNEENQSFETPNHNNYFQIKPKTKTKAENENEYEYTDINKNIPTQIPTQKKEKTKNFIKENSQIEFNSNEHIDYNENEGGENQLEEQEQPDQQEGYNYYADIYATLSVPSSPQKSEEEEKTDDLIQFYNTFPKEYDQQEIPMLTRMNSNKRNFLINKLNKEISLQREREKNKEQDNQIIKDDYIEENKKKLRLITPKQKAQIKPKDKDNSNEQEEDNLIIDISLQEDKTFSLVGEKEGINDNEVNEEECKSPKVIDKQKQISKSERERKGNLSGMPKKEYEILLYKGTNKNKNKRNEEETNEEISLLPSLKELDQKIAQLKKEINALDIMENITEQTTLLCFEENDINEEDKQMLEQAKKINKDFYDEIDAKLQMAEEAIECQFKQ